MTRAAWPLVGEDTSRLLREEGVGRGRSCWGSRLLPKSGSPRGILPDGFWFLSGGGWRRPPGGRGRRQEAPGKAGLAAGRSARPSPASPQETPEAPGGRPLGGSERRFRQNTWVSRTRTHSRNLRKTRGNLRGTPRSQPAGDPPGSGENALVSGGGRCCARAPLVARATPPPSPRPLHCDVTVRPPRRGGGLTAGPTSWAKLRRFPCATRQLSRRRAVASPLHAGQPRVRALLTPEP